MRLISRARRTAGALFVLLLAAATARTAQSPVRIQIHSGKAASGSPVKAISLSPMALGSSRPGGAAPLSVPAGVRIRGVAVALQAEPAQGLSAIPELPASAIGAAAAPSAALGAPARPPEQIALGGSSARRANELSRGLAGPAGLGETSLLKLRETIGASFDNAGRPRAQEVDVFASPVTAEELFGPAQKGIVEVEPGQAARLARLADETARLRGIRATRGEGALSDEDAALLRGIDDLARAAAIANTTPAELAAAARTVAGMDLAVLRRFVELASRFVNTDVPGKSSPFARAGNVEHIHQQLIEPLARDGGPLAAAFKRSPGETAEHFVEALKALQYATDTGKQQIPDDMKAALARFNSQAEAGPDWYINNFILPHEYASIRWVGLLGREVGMNASQILAFQRLIANHNFGPSLTEPGNADLREHWWPKNFRRNMLPMLRAMGIDVTALFKADERGVLQYNDSRGNPIALLLAVYDRALAVKGNGNGLATWKKFAVQDFNGKKGRLKGLRQRNAAKRPGEALEPDPGSIFEFDGPSVVRAMEASADWAERHVGSLWASLHASLPARGPARWEYPTFESFRGYPPFAAQRDSLAALQRALERVKAANPEGISAPAELAPGPGLAYYRASSKELAGLYRVKLERVGPGASDPRSADYDYAARVEVHRNGAWVQPSGGPLAAGVLAARGPDPVVLLLDLVRRDLGS